MPNFCKGGLYDGMEIRGLKIKLSCIKNEGIIEREDTQGCVAASIAPIALIASHTEQNISAICTPPLLPLRMARDSLGRSALVIGLDALNARIFPEVERIAEENDEIKTALTNVFIDASFFSASMLESHNNGSNGAKSVFTKSLYQQTKNLRRK